MPSLRSLSIDENYDSRRGSLWQWLTLAFIAGGLLAGLASLFMGLVIWTQLPDVPDLNLLRDYQHSDSISIYDRYDKLICSVSGGQNRKRVSLSEISPAAVSAVLAAEDHNFFEHHGISISGICRSFLANVWAGKIVEGGSTITQQLVKNLFFPRPQRKLERKLAEAYIAGELERRYSKNEILEMYLNEAYFGNGAYGIEQAAQYYFGKSAAQLSLAESAFLAGLIKAPSKLGAVQNKSLALEQQQQTIDNMQRFGFVSPMRAEFARKQPLAFVEKEPERGIYAVKRFPYYVSYILDLVSQHVSPRELEHGLKVYTALDPVAQETAERMLRQGLSGAPRGITNGALASVLVRDGSVIALVGGIGDFRTNQYNCATHAHTVGSAFKPFVYLTALEKGLYNPESKVDDSPLVIKQSGQPDWIPHNFDNKFMGPITLREALALSRNVCAVRVAQEVGIDDVVKTAQRAGIWDKLDDNLSLALGSSAISPIDLAGGYSTFARGGIVIKPWVLKRVESAGGRIIKVFDQPLSRAFDPQPVSDLVSMMHDVVTSGTGQEANLSNCFVAGKTGTADQARDLWFVGFTPDIVTAVWAGNDKDTPIEGAHVSGGTVMARIWRQYYTALYQNETLAHTGLLLQTTTAAAPIPSMVPRRTEPRAHPQKTAQTANPMLKPLEPKTDDSKRMFNDAADAERALRLKF